MVEDGCPFCDVLESEIVAADGPCVAIWTNQLPRGSLMVIPRAHRREPWDLSAQEWSATQVLLRTMTERIGEIRGCAGGSSSRRTRSTLDLGDPLIAAVRARNQACRRGLIEAIG